MQVYTICILQRTMYFTKNYAFPELKSQLLKTIKYCVGYINLSTPSSSVISSVINNIQIKMQIFQTEDKQNLLKKKSNLFFTGHPLSSCKVYRTLLENLDWTKICLVARYSRKLEHPGCHGKVSSVYSTQSHSSQSTCKISKTSSI